MKIITLIVACAIAVAFFALTLGAVIPEQGIYQGALLALLAAMLGFGFTYSLVRILLDWGE